MGITAAALLKLVQSTIARFADTSQPDGQGVLTASEQSALLTATQPGGVLDSFIASQINTRSAGPPVGTLPGAQAIFSTGRLHDNSPSSIGAWAEAKAIAQNSGGRIYSINQTGVGSFLDQDGAYDPAVNAVANLLGPFPATTALRAAVMQIVNGAGSYNFASLAPANALLVYGFEVNPNSIFYNTEVPAFAANHTNMATFNAVSIGSLSQAANFKPETANSSFAASNPILTSSMSTIGYDSSTAAFAAVTGPNAGSAVVTRIGNIIDVTTNGDAVVVGQGTSFRLRGNYNVVDSANGANVQLVSGNLGDTIKLNSGVLTIDSYAGGWGSDALNLVGSNNTVTMGANDILLVQGNNNTVNAGDSSYVGVLTGSNGTHINMLHGSIYSSAGTEIYATGNDLLIQVADIHDWGKLHVGITTKLTIREVAPDNTRVDVNVFASPTVSSFMRESVTYLADGRKFSDAIHSWDGSFGVRYYNYTNTNVGTGWGETIMLFDSSGKAIQQITYDRDGSVYVTVFANYSNRPMNVTFVYATEAAANAAISANDWKIQELVASNGSPAYWSGANAIIAAQNAGEAGVFGTTWGQLPSWLSTGGALSGVSQIQWVQGFQQQVDYVTMRPTYLLGNNTAAWNQVGADTGYLNNLILDPLVLNLNGASVDTTAKGENGVRFDMLGDGVLRETGWVSAGEAILVNGSQIPTSGSSFTTVQQLGSLDVDHDGIVTANEASSLAIWQPAAGGGGGTVSSLQQLGIAAINLDWKALWAPQPGALAPLGQVDHGNLISSSFTFTYENGSVGHGADVTFGVGVTDAEAHATGQGLVQAAAGFGVASSAGFPFAIAAALTGGAQVGIAPPPLI